MIVRDAGYFINGGAGDATNQNTLWGDYVYTNHLGGLECGRPGRRAETVSGGG